MKKGAAIIVFQKKPEIGNVKTRLAKTIGDKMAVEVYRYLLNHTHRQIAQVKIPTFVFFEKEVQPDFLLNKNYHAAIQNKGDIGDKMKAAFQQVFDLHYQRVIAIGTDCMELEAETLKEALSSLKADDIVIGPALDGGYYLLGMRKPHGILFENKEWSSSTVFSDTLADVKRLNLRTSILKKLSDIDTYDDLNDELKKILNID